MPENIKEKLLLHTCCAVCGTLIARRLKENFEPIIFFSNSNIYPKEEYEKRLSAAKQLAIDNDIPLIEDDYNHSEWLNEAKVHADEPEGGKRCGICFDSRLYRSAKKAKELGIQKLTTTLALSPYKDEARVEQLGTDAAGAFGIIFFAPWKQFEKKIFWNDNMREVRETGIYRQRYCGCEFSINKNKKAISDKTLN